MVVHNIKEDDDEFVLHLDALNSCIHREAKKESKGNFTFISKDMGVIRDKQTKLTKEELMDFLRKCSYNTFSYFKVPPLFQHQGLSHYYMIWIAPIERSTNKKSNDQGSNNSISSIQSRPESAIKPESEMTLEEFFLTTKSY